MSGGFVSSLFRRKKSDKVEPTSFGNPRVFKYKELKEATSSFTKERLFSAYGRVYIGILADGRQVAVRAIEGSYDEITRYVAFHFHLRHKNVVTLLGCTDPGDKEYLLVYELPDNASLHDHLHCGGSDLTLALRVQIATETAEALVYLHTLDHPFVHGAVNSATIMLDHSFHVKLGGFDIRRLMDPDYDDGLDGLVDGSTLRRSDLGYHMGYRDPEYDRTGSITVKCDVYRFGVLMVELISGKEPCAFSPDPDNRYLIPLAELISGKKPCAFSPDPDNRYLTPLALNKIKNNNLDDLVDAKLGYNSDIHLNRVINSLAELAGRCLHPTGIMRPTMKQVLTDLMKINYELKLQQIGGLNAPLQELGDDSLVNDSLGKEKSDEEEPTNFGLARVFKHEELKKATNSFTTELGVGGFGSVYLGTLIDGQKVAVKLLHNNNPKRLKEFITEVMVLSNLRHDNLVTLHGCTNPRGKELLLVYEYVPNGTVFDHLHGGRSDLTLAVRVQIAVETAEALAYLHARVPPLIHRDVKTSNIMLDNGFHVKVGDLGMSRLLPWDATQVTTVPQGTLGYRDPEYDRTLVLTVKSDVYSIGVLVVELISGKKAVDVNRAPDNICLADLALDKINNNKLDDFVDPKLGYNSNVCVKRAIDSLAELACKCLHSTRTMRPTMEQVLTELKQIEDVFQRIGLSVPLQELGYDNLTDGPLIEAAEKQ